ncbi:MAG: hypothetical protein A2X12_06190 [Bacteroidetes bacterium GWE2_29_8]|nr:MAG: hypothetical protein A2X12_06190 [Bacteroidetes bacterium GWE2_29_8]OFY14343.1 MAG: hypothetical protein A2X02_05040 [Bacteroidetes bacterium GWF2_29_10]
MRKQFYFVLIILSFCFTTIAQTRIYSNEFLSIGAGSKAIGMGGAVTASVNDVTSGYWNPAGLTNIQNNIQLSFMHSEYFAGIAKYDYAAFATKIDATSTIGFSFLRFGVDDIPDTSELIDSDGNVNYDKVKSFSAFDYAFLISYARKHKGNENLSYGGSAKIIRRVAGNFASAWGFGIDIGAQYKLNKWLLGFSGKDITTTFNAWKFNTENLEEVFIRTNNEIPQNSIEITVPRIIPAIAREFELPYKLGLLAALDMEMTFDGKRNTFIKSKAINIDPKIGLELNYKKLVFIRAGVSNIQKITDVDNKENLHVQPNIGIGINFKNKFILDYAISNVGDNTYNFYSNMFSLVFNINRKDKSL